MPSYGFKLMTELHPPAELLRQARAAEEAGFDFVGISDHVHPWLESHGHSPFAWSVLGAVAEATDRVEIVTMVTCPYRRYHPAIVAQMAATIAVMSDGRFRLGVGGGELLNEHVVGGAWPPADERHEVLAEAVEAMKELWQGGYRTFRGRHVEVVDARVFDLPAEPMPVLVAAGGPQSAELAGRVGDGLIAIDPEASIVEAYTGAGGDPAATWCEVSLSWHADEAEAKRLAHERFRFGALGWKVMAELPNVANFEAATEHVTPDVVAGNVPCGPDPEAHAEAIRAFADAGFEHVAVLPVGDDLEGFLRFWTDELRPLLP